MRFNTKGNLIFIAAIVLASSSLFPSTSASPIAHELGIIDVHKRAPAPSSSHAAAAVHASASASQKAPAVRAVSTVASHSPAPAAAAGSPKAATSHATSSAAGQSRAVNTSAAASPALPVQPTGDSVSASSSSPSSTQASMNYQSGASVNTGLSMPLIGGIAAVGGVIVVAIGFFAVVRYRKQKELTKKLSSGANPFTNLGAGSAPNATPVSASPFPPNSPYDRLEDAKPLGTFTVISTYTPTLGDELDIQPGDKVTVLCEYDDGWVQGINETKGRLKGVFPKHCVDFGQAHESNRDSMLGGDKRVKRVSSMYGNNGSYGA